MYCRQHMHLFESFHSGCLFFWLNCLLLVIRWAVKGPWASSSFQFSSLKVIILWFCLNSRWIRCLILVSRSREHPSAVLYTQVVRTQPISAKIHKSKAVYFLISNDVSGICSWCITLVWTHSKFTFTHVCKYTHVQICTRKQIFAVWMGLKLTNKLCIVFFRNVTFMDF